MMQRLARHAKLTAVAVTIVVLAALLPPPSTLWAQTLQVANAAADLTGKILMVANSTTPRTVSNLFTFDRSPSAPFAVTAASAKVTNLDADKLDGLDSLRLTTTVVTTVLNGTQNNFDPGISSGGGPTVIIANNGSALTITGFPAGIAGQRITVVPMNAQVNFAHADAGSSVGNKLQNWVATPPLAIAGTRTGSATYVYDTNGAVWELETSLQGASVAYTPTWGNTGTANSIGNGTLTGTYILTGKHVEGHIALTFGTTTSSGNGAWSFTLPIIADSFGGQAATSIALDASGPNTSYFGTAVNSSTTVITPTTIASPVVGYTLAVPFGANWATGDTYNLHFDYFAQ